MLICVLLRLSLILRGFGYCGAVDLFACGLSRFGVGVYLRGLLLIGGFVIGCLYWLDSVLVCGVVFGLRLGLVWVCVLVGVGFSWLVLGFVCRGFALRGYG